MNRIESIANILREKGYEVEIKNVQKGDETKIGLIMGDGRIRPTIYPDFAEESDEEAAELVIKIYKQMKVSDDCFEVDNFLDYEQIKKQIVVCVRRPTSEKCIDIKRPFLDLELYVRAKVTMGIFDDEIASIVIKPEHLKLWNVSEDKVFVDAIANTSRFTKIKSIKEIILSNASQEEKEFIELLSVPNDMYLLTAGNLGAGAICCMEKIKEIADTLEGNIYIIPASVHEILIVGGNRDSGLADISEMVANVNREQVIPEERLSDHAYLYDKVTGLISY